MVVIDNPVHPVVGVDVVVDIFDYQIDVGVKAFEFIFELFGKSFGFDIKPTPNCKVGVINEITLFRHFKSELFSNNRLAARRRALQQNSIVFFEKFFELIDFFSPDCELYVVHIEPSDFERFAFATAGKSFPDLFNRFSGYCR